MRPALALLAIISLVILGCGGEQSTDKPSTDSPTPTTDAPKTDTGTGTTDAPKTDGGSGTQAGFAAVQAIVNTRCGTCHTGPSGKERLDVSSYASLMKGTEHGPIIIPGKPDESLIMKVMSGNGAKQMPPRGKGQPATTEEMKTISDWIAAGASEN